MWDKKTKPPIHNKIDYETGMNRLYEFYIFLGRPPKQDDFKEHNWEPPLHWYHRNTGGLLNALVELNIIDKPLDENTMIENSILLLKELAKKLNKCPTVTDYDNALIKYKHYHRRTLENKLDMKYNDICRKYIPDYDLNNDRDYTYDDIANSIHNCIKELGKVPTYKEYKKYCNGVMSSQSVIKKVSGMTFLDFLDHLGYDSLSTTTKTMNKNEALNKFKELCIELGRVPLCCEVGERKDMPTQPSYIKYFGSIDNVIKLLNMEDFKINQIGFGKTVRDKNGGTCRSVSECTISNYLIDNDIPFTKENSYGELIKGDKHRFDWKVNLQGNVYYIEYFGLYVDKPYNKQTKKYYDKTMLKINLLKKYNVIDQCIFIFPDDLKNKSLDEIFEPYYNDNNYKKVSNL